MKKWMAEGVSLLSLVAVSAAAATVLYLCAEARFYAADNAQRRDPMENLARFHGELKKYCEAHEGRYPAGQGVEGLGELVVKLSDLRVKDDRYVGTDPDYLSERITSYAYVASGLRREEVERDMPVIFEKPWNRERVRIFLGDGRVEMPDLEKFKSCRTIVAYCKERSQRDSPAWETLLRNAEEIDRRR